MRRTMGFSPPAGWNRGIHPPAGRTFSRIERTREASRRRMAARSASRRRTRAERARPISARSDWGRRPIHGASFPRSPEVEIDDEAEGSPRPAGGEGMGGARREEGGSAAADGGRGAVDAPLLPLAGDVDEELGVGMLVEGDDGSLLDMPVQAQAVDPGSARPGGGAIRGGGAGNLSWKPSLA